MSSSLKGKVALVTGASRGIGAATARLLGSKGATVGVHYGSSKESALSVCKEIEASGGTAFAVPGDLSNSKGVTLLVEGFLSELETRFKSPEFDILVNNAGIAPSMAFEETDEATFDKLIQVNVQALYVITQQLGKHIRPNGRIINLSSVVVFKQFPDITAYSLTKGAVDTLTLHLAPIFGARGITVNSVNPGATDTEMNPWLKEEEGQDRVKAMQALKRVGNADDIAKVIAFVASDDSGWMTGQKFDTSGGAKL